MTTLEMLAISIVAGWIFGSILKFFAIHQYSACPKYDYKK